MYAVTQMKCCATPELDQKPTNEASHEEAETEQSIIMANPASEQRCRERCREVESALDLFPCFVVFFFESSSLTAVAHKPKGQGEYFSH